MLNKILLIIIIISILGCKTVPKIIYKYVDKEISCQQVDIPEFPKFNYDKELTDPENISVLLEILNIYKKYVEDLNSVIECYLKQTKKDDKTYYILINNKNRALKNIKYLERIINEIKKK